MKELVIKGKDGKVYAIQLSQITYYRSYVESSKEMKDKPSLKTVIYFVGSTKALLVPVSFDEFVKLKKQVIEE
jgi:hypothetical protein